jgi:tRNA G46 methylase TrmB
VAEAFIISAGASFKDGFMEALHGILVEGGELRVKTDDLPYFQWMEKVFARAKGTSASTGRTIRLSNH